VEREVWRGGWGGGVVAISHAIFLHHVYLKFQFNLVLV